MAGSTQSMQHRDCTVRDGRCLKATGYDRVRSRPILDLSRVAAHRLFAAPRSAAGGAVALVGCLPCMQQPWLLSRAPPRTGFGPDDSFL